MQTIKVSWRHSCQHIACYQWDELDAFPYTEEEARQDRQLAATYPCDECCRRELAAADARIRAARLDADNFNAGNVR